MGTDSQNWARQVEKAAGDVVSSRVDSAKTAEAIAITGNAAEVYSRGGVNAQGYYNDVAAHKQLTANERKSVTLPNGNIDTMGMLGILNRKEAEYNGTAFGNDAGFYAPNAEPITPAAIPTALAPAVIQPPPPPVKTAPIDTVLFDDESVSIDIMTDLIFENIGGHELINIARNDIVNGQQVSYQPIKNLSSIQQQYNPNNILSLQSTSDKYFANFAIKLENKVPDPGTGPNGSYVYLDSDTGSMIVEAINLEVDEQIQIEITTSGTIYEAEFGEVTS